MVSEEYLRNERKRTHARIAKLDARAYVLRQRRLDQEDVTKAHREAQHQRHYNIMIAALAEEAVQRDDAAAAASAALPPPGLALGWVDSTLTQAYLDRYMKHYSQAALKFLRIHYPTNESLKEMLIQLDQRRDQLLNAKLQTHKEESHQQTEQLKGSWTLIIQQLKADLGKQFGDRFDEAFRKTQEELWALINKTNDNIDERFATEVSLTVNQLTLNFEANIKAQINALQMFNETQIKELEETKNKSLMLQEKNVDAKIWEFRRDIELLDEQVRTVQEKVGALEQAQNEYLRKVEFALQDAVETLKATKGDRAKFEESFKKTSAQFKNVGVELRIITRLNVEIRSLQSDVSADVITYNRERTNFKETLQNEMDALGGQLIELRSMVSAGQKDVSVQEAKINQQIKDLETEIAGVKAAGQIFRVRKQSFPMFPRTGYKPLP
tara:strand:- start:1728 stop:3047 length:1320 start_codon:yes stop_codon:yes gene_type:complete